MPRTPAKPSAVPSPADELSVGELARRSGIPVSALHFYEARGLIGSLRTGGNQRRYPRGMLRRLGVIRAAQRLGVPLAEIAVALSALPPGRPPTERDWQRLSAVWREQLDQRIHSLLALRDDLDGCIGCGCLSLKVCPLRNPGDRLAGEGAGPRLLGACRKRQPA